MIRSTLQALTLLGLTAGLSFASHIVGGMLQYGALSSDGQVFNTNINGGTTTINEGRDAGGLVFGGPSPITYNGGGSFNTVLNGSADYNDFHALTSTLSGLSATPIVSWLGVTPGVYSFTTAPTTVTLASPGIYVFKYVGGTALAFNNVNVMSAYGQSVASDDVVWYVPQAVSMVNSTFGGVLVVDNFGATIEANGAETTIGGRVLTESAVDLLAWNGGTLTFGSQMASDIPEPSTILLLVPALAIGAMARRRRARQ
jgi:hypothetical protein